MYLRENCIQNVHLGRYIVGYMVGNFVLRRRVSGAVKRNFRPYNRWYTSTNEHFEYSYPHSNALFNMYSSKAQHFELNWSFASNVKQLRQPITSDATYDVGAPTLYGRIYWRKFLTLSTQTSRYISKCIRISVDVKANHRWNIAIIIRDVHKRLLLFKFKRIFKVISIWRNFKVRLLTFKPRHDKTSKMYVRPAKTRISLGIRPDWSESSLSASRKFGSLATH